MAPPSSGRPEPASHWLRVGEAARELAIGEQRVRRLVDRGELEAIRTSLGRLIWPDSVRQYKRANQERYP